MIIMWKDAVVVRGKIWRSLDLANQSNVNSNNHQTSVTTVSNVHHNSLINANQTSNYQRHDFKNRRSSSEPANEQKMLAHTHSTTQNYNNSNNNYNNNSQNTSTAINQTTNTINSNSSSNNQTNSNSTNNSMVIDDENPSDDFIDCLHQKTIQKVSKYPTKKPIRIIIFRNDDFYIHFKKISFLSTYLSFSLSIYLN